MNKKTIILIIIAICVGGLIYFFSRSTTGNQGASLFKMSGSSTATSTALFGPSGKFPITNQLLCSLKQKNPQVRVITPNGNEIFTPGQQILVKWQTCNWNALNSVHISIYSAVYNQFQEITISSNDGQELITVPSTFEYLGVQPITFGNHYKIRLALNGNLSLKDESNNNFSIVDPNSNSASSTHSGTSTSGTSTSGTSTSGTSTSGTSTTSSTSSSTSTGSVSGSQKISVKRIN